MNERKREMGFWEALNSPPPVAVGGRVRLVKMVDDPAPIPPGTEGTVTGGNGGQIYVRWDNGRTLMLLPRVDEFEVLP